MIDPDNKNNITDGFDITTQYSDLFEGKNKKIDCPYEIVFNVNAHIMEQNSDGQDMSCQQVSNKNFHIPVKDGADPTVFMNTFFMFLQNCLAQSAKHAYENTSGNSSND